MEKTGFFLNMEKIWIFFFFFFFFFYLHPEGSTITTSREIYYAQIGYPYVMEQNKIFVCYWLIYEAFLMVSNNKIRK